MRRLLAAAAVAVLVAGPACAVSDPREMLPDPGKEARAEAIGARLRCLVCQNEDIENSGADLARDLRHLVRVQVNQNRSDRQIMDWMVLRYGAFIRLDPPVSFSTLLLWAAGPLALLAGGIAAWLGMRRSHRAPPGPLDAAEQARLAELTR